MQIFIEILYPFQRKLIFLSNSSKFLEIVNSDRDSKILAIDAWCIANVAMKLVTPTAATKMTISWLKLADLTTIIYKCHFILFQVLENPHFNEWIKCKRLPIGRIDVDRTIKKHFKMYVFPAFSSWDLGGQTNVKLNTAREPLKIVIGILKSLKDLEQIAIYSVVVY